MTDSPSNPRRRLEDDAGGATQPENARQRKPAGPFSSWRARQLRGVSKELVEAELALLPRRIYEGERNPLLPSRDRAGKPIPRSMAVREERILEVLRFLGRVYVADAETVFHMLYRRSYDLATTYRDLRVALNRKLIWKDRALGLHDKISPRVHPTNPRAVYGLSKVGQQFLKNSAVEPDARVIAMMHAHPAGKPQVANQATLGHDLQVSWWCASMVECLRLIPWCSGVFCQSEVRSHKRQRIDAVIVARFNFRRQRENLDAIPWFDGRPAQPDEIEVRWALELDNSTESGKVLLGKFINYRNLHAEGVYHTLFNGNMILVLIVQNPDRAAYLAAEFRRAWPEGWGLVTTPDRMGADARALGVLWGRYFDMNSEAQVPLLSELARDPATGGYAYHPLLPYPVWERYLRLVQAGAAPESLFDLESDL